MVPAAARTATRSCGGEAANVAISSSTSGLLDALRLAGSGEDHHADGASDFGERVGHGGILSPRFEATASEPMSGMRHLDSSRIG